MISVVLFCASLQWIALKSLPLPLEELLAVNGSVMLSIFSTNGYP